MALEPKTEIFTALKVHRDFSKGTKRVTARIKECVSSDICKIERSKFNVEKGDTPYFLENEVIVENGVIVIFFAFF